VHLLLNAWASTKSHKSFVFFVRVTTQLINEKWHQHRQAEKRVLTKKEKYEEEEKEEPALKWWKFHLTYISNSCKKKRIITMKLKI